MSGTSRIARAGAAIAAACAAAALSGCTTTDALTLERPATSAAAKADALPGDIKDILMAGGLNVADPGAPTAGRPVLVASAGTGADPMGAALASVASGKGRRVEPTARTAPETRRAEPTLVAALPAPTPSKARPAAASRQAPAAPRAAEAPAAPARVPVRVAAPVQVAAIETPAPRAAARPSEPDAERFASGPAPRPSNPLVEAAASGAPASAAAFNGGTPDGPMPKVIAPPEPGMAEAAGKGGRVRRF